jgi:hypothetical protein
VTSLRWNPLVVVVVRLANHREGASIVADFPPLSSRRATCDVEPLHGPVLAKLLIFSSPMPSPCPGATVICRRPCSEGKTTLRARLTHARVRYVAERSGLSSAGGATMPRSWPISTSPRHATHGVSPAESPPPPNEHLHERQYAHSCARRRLMERST